MSNNLGVGVSYILSGLVTHQDTEDPTVHKSQMVLLLTIYRYLGLTDRQHNSINPRVV